MFANNDKIGPYLSSERFVHYGDHIETLLSQIREERLERDGDSGTGSGPDMPG